MNLLDKIKNIGGGESHKSGGSQQDWYITAEGAVGIDDVDHISKSDPYLLIEFGGKEVRTKTVENDRSPSWNQTFHFKLRPDQADRIHLKLRDDDMGFDDGLGHATVSRADLPNLGEEKTLKVPLFRKEKITAMVTLRVKGMHEGGQLPYQGTNVQQTHYPQQQFQQPMMNQQQPYGQQQNYTQQQQQPYTQQQQQPYTQQQQQPYTQNQQQPHQQTQQQPNFQGGQQQSYMNQPNSYYGQQRH